ncbi:MAG TPA: hypothetical protein VF526_12210 [Solirubrobacteraceae bacterium]
MVQACADCGRNRRVEARTYRGALCTGCFRRALRAKVVCHGCGQRRRPVARDERGELCASCADDPGWQRCRSCGAEELNWRDGRCPVCCLESELAALAAVAEPDALGRLSPYLASLRDRAQPKSVLEWMQVSPAWRTVLAMLNGELQISHDTLDSHDQGHATGYLRAALVTAGALEPRDETLARFARWADAQVNELPEHPDRVHLAAYASWGLHGDLARRTHNGTAKPSTHRNARRKLRVAIMFAGWLHDQGRALADARQDLVEDWLADAPSRSLPLRDFLQWAHHAGISMPIEIRRPASRASIEPINQQALLTHTRALLHADDVELPARVAAILVLLLGQPVTRLVALKHSDVSHKDDRVLLALGREPVQLPPPLATLVLRLTEQRSGSPWLFPGAKAGAAISAERMQRRLQQLGVSARSGRSGALMSLAGTLPPSILADLLGYCDDTANAWRQAAGGDWARYAALATDSPPR